MSMLSGIFHFVLIQKNKPQKGKFTNDDKKYALLIAHHDDDSI